MKSSFALLWASETILDVASALVGFALGVWIVERTGSAEQFARSVLAAAAPATLLTPFAGILADRFDRRWVIGSCDVALAATVALLAWMVFQNRLTVHFLYCFNVIGAAAASIRMPAYRATVSVIVPKNRMTQASGLIGLTQNLLQTAAPLVAGYLMGVSGLKGVVVVDMILVTAGAAAIFGALTRVSKATDSICARDDLSAARGIAEGFFSVLHYFKANPLMSGAAAYSLLQESLLILVTSMIAPLVLSTKSSDALGVILTCGALGGLAGSALLLFLRIDKHLMAWALVSDAVLSVFVLVAGFAATTPSWCVCAFFAVFAGSVSAGCIGALWMRKTPKAKQGSIFGLIQSLNFLAMCAVMLAGGYLSERVFEPALAVHGSWAGTVGAWVGTGKGRGLAFMFIVCGMGSCLASLTALTQSGMRRLDEFVPDHADASGGEAAPSRASDDCAI